MKPGWKTSEFWLLVAFNVGLAFLRSVTGIEIDDATQAQLHALTVGVYTFARGLSKAKAGARSPGGEVEKDS